jgi:hypothetical protein
MPEGAGTPRFTAGDAIVLAYSGSDPAADASYQVVDFQRGTPLLILAATFAVAVLLLGRWQGVAALAALPAEPPPWRILRSTPRVGLWTDDFHNLLSIFKW